MVIVRTHTRVNQFSDMQDKQKVTLYLPPGVHRQLKIRAAIDEESMSGLVEKAIAFYLKYPEKVEEIDRRRELEGKGKVRRDNAGDQSLNTHLLNGLFPANLIEKRLEKLNTTVRRVVKESRTESRGCSRLCRSPCERAYSFPQKDSKPEKPCLLAAHNPESNRID